MTGSYNEPPPSPLQYIYNGIRFLENWIEPPEPQSANSESCQLHREQGKGTTEPATENTTFYSQQSNHREQGTEPATENTTFYSQQSNHREQGTEPATENTTF